MALASPVIAGPFTGLVVTGDQDGERIVRVDLDAATQPFMADHLVGGRPLLSTVMGAEAMAHAAIVADSAQGTPPVPAVTEVVDLRVHQPLRLAADGRGTASVLIVPDPDACRDARASRGGWACRLVTHGQEAAHFEATVLRRAPRLAPAPVDPPRRGPRHPQAGADDIYALYFHGPSFQVVHSAFWADGVMVADLAQDLPELARPPGPSATSPLLIELCLQTAGLYEIGATGRMMIPASIDRITRYTSADAHHGRALRAVVRPRTDRPGDRRRMDRAGETSFDAVVVDDAGTVHLSVQGYRTAPFAHPPDATALAPLTRALSGIS